MSEPLEPRRSDDPAPPTPWAGSQAQPEGEPATNMFPAPPQYDPPPAYPPVSGMPASGAPSAYPADPYSAPVSGTAQLPAAYQPSYHAPLPVPYPPAPASYPPAMYPPAMYQPAAFGYDPISGQPYSDKSKVIAGLLQLLPAIVFSFGGIGRIYAGNTTLGAVQMAASVVGWICFWCGILANVFVLFLPLVLYVGIWLWFVIDAIVLFAGRPVDGQGRLLRS